MARPMPGRRGSRDVDPGRQGLVAAERGDREVLARVKRECQLGRAPLTNGVVLAQVWRGGYGKQVPVAQLLASVEVTAVDDRLGNWRGCCSPGQAAQTPSTRR